jgi:hypothetical protein
MGEMGGLKQAMLAHEQHRSQQRLILAREIKSLDDATEKRRVYAQDASSVVTASIHYQQNTR